MGAFARLGNDLYAGRRSIDFIGRKWVWYGISAVLVLVSIVGLSVRGLDLGIEFTGGTSFRVQIADGATQDDVDGVRQAVVDTGVEAAAAPVVTTAGADGVLVQTEPMNADDSAVVAQAILDETGLGQNALTQSDIGASWGAQVAERALIGLVIFLVLVVLFIWAYFRELKMSIAALVALAHDVVITIGVYALSGFTVTPATVTGVLTILAFSLYDTVVVFDKVKENARAMKRNHQTYAEAANLAVNQTLVRSINTSVVALLPIASILWVGALTLGASSLQDLALALFVGTAAGTFSSIFIATPLLVQMKAGEDEVKIAEKRARAHHRNADRYAAVPTFRENMPVGEEPGEDDGTDPEDEDAEPARSGMGRASTDAMGRGRTAPAAHGPMDSGTSAGRTQPTRKPRSQRGKPQK
ncbi:protein translocase subunit SecF [Nocardioides bruguierae]|uniref:Protein-export membrane protein SecF n=1 Tax=Nocardioides bruguierae TaxID=2945102 RepID=A0A9X2DCS6_9ACTN|nr:protein translocase subunit SecF [Nocardioides bruguierae]MCM0622094.1 protein translocase subunit SecF [Nocardioides bruguierae]